MWSDYQAGVTGLVIFQLSSPVFSPGLELGFSCPGPQVLVALEQTAGWRTQLYTVSRVTPGYQLGSPVVGVS